MDSNDLKKIFEDVASIDIKELEIPTFKIPNWPSEANVALSFDKNDVTLILKSKKSGLLYKEIVNEEINFWIDGDGAFGFAIALYENCSYKKILYYYSRAGEKHNRNREGPFGFELGHEGDTQLSRLGALLLFQQLKDECVEKVFALLRHDSKIHNAILIEARKALEPFMPYVAAEEFGKV